MFSIILKYVILIGYNNFKQKEMKNLYKELHNLSNKVNEKIYSHFANCYEVDKKELFELPENIDGLDIDECVLILGINPSASDITRNGIKQNCFIKYIPTNSDTKVVESLKKAGYTYDKYFKRHYELYCDLGFNMLWQNSNYLNRFNDILTKEQFEFLQGYISEKKKYIIFSDLVFVKETKSKEIEQILGQDNKSIYSLFKMQLEYYKPKQVLVTNASASLFLHEQIKRELQIKDDLIYSEINYNDVPIIFSSMVSGTRALDRFNYMRLKKDIEKHF